MTAQLRLCLFDELLGSTAEVKLQRPSSYIQCWFVIPLLFTSVVQSVHVGSKIRKKFVEPCEKMSSNERMSFPTMQMTFVRDGLNVTNIILIRWQFWWIHIDYVPTRWIWLRQSIDENSWPSSASELATSLIWRHRQIWAKRATVWALRNSGNHGRFYMSINSSSLKKKQSKTRSSSIRHHCSHCQLQRNIYLLKASYTLISILILTVSTQQISGYGDYIIVQTALVFLVPSAT